MYFRNLMTICLCGGVLSCAPQRITSLQPEDKEAYKVIDAYLFRYNGKGKIIRTTDTWFDELNEGYGPDGQLIIEQVDYENILVPELLNYGLFGSIKHNNFSEEFALRLQEKFEALEPRKLQKKYMSVPVKLVNKRRMNYTEFIWPVIQDDYAFLIVRYCCSRYGDADIDLEILHRVDGKWKRKNDFNLICGF